jgi:hypothetical protein
LSTIGKIVTGKIANFLLGDQARKFKVYNIMVYI